jgi:S-adenosylmethionine synthetase
VGAGLAKRCTVQLAYAIGVAEPVSVSVETHGTGIVPDVEIAAAVRVIWDLTPAGIIRELDLLRPIYTATSALGHFGRWKSPELFRWERLDQSDLLLAKIGGR